MEFWYFLLVAAVTFIVWVIFDKKSTLSAAIRARFHGVKAKATNLLDDANSQMEAAEAEIESKLSRTRSGLINIKAKVKSAKRDLDKAQYEAREWKKGVAAALKVGDRELAKSCLIRQKEYEELLPELQAQYDELFRQEEVVDDAYQEFQRQQRVVKQKKQSIEARTIVAKSQQDINDLLAGITSGGHLDSVARALELVEEAEDRASATGEVKTEAQKEQDLKDRLAKLPKKEDLDAELDRLTQEYASSNPDNSAT